MVLFRVPIFIPSIYISAINLRLFVAGRTLGSRLRDFSGSSVATVKRFVEDEKPQEVRGLRGVSRRSP